MPEVMAGLGLWRCTLNSAILWKGSEHMESDFIFCDSALWETIEFLANEYTDCCDRINLCAVVGDSGGLQEKPYLVSPDGVTLEERYGAYIQDIDKALCGICDSDRVLSLAMSF